MLDLLRGVDFKRVSIVVLIVIVLAIAAAVKIQIDQLATAKVVYLNPRVVEHERVVKIRGPVRIVTKIVERTSGEKETTVTEDRATVVETNAADRESIPVPLAVTLAPPNTNKWLCGFGNRNFSYRSWDQYSLWAGREFGRVVVLGGLGYRESPEAQAVLLVKWGR